MKVKTTTKKATFAKEITIIVCVKVAALAAIWALFFSDPVKAQLDDAKLVGHLISADA